MNVLVDTPIWSMALRRHPPIVHPLVAELGELIREFRAHMIGPVRQEVLSGIRDGAQYERLRDRMRGFADVPLMTEDYERAAEFTNVCRSKGIQGAPTDLLLCAVADHRHFAILTTDADFALYGKHIPVKLHRVRTAH